MFFMEEHTGRACHWTRVLWAYEAELDPNHPQHHLFMRKNIEGWEHLRSTFLEREAGTDKDHNKGMEYAVHQHGLELAGNGYDFPAACVVYDGYLLNEGVGNLERNRIMRNVLNF